MYVIFYLHNNTKIIYSFVLVIIMYVFIVYPLKNSIKYVIKNFVILKIFLVYEKTTKKTQKILPGTFLPSTWYFSTKQILNLKTTK